MLRLVVIVVALALGGLVSLSTSACHGSRPPATVEPPKPRPRDAHDIASAIVGARVTAMVWLDRVRGHPVAALIASEEEWKASLQGVDPVCDVDRAFVASTGIHHDDVAVVVAEHSLAPDRVKQALDSAVASSQPPGEWVDVGQRAARVNLRGYAGIVAPITDKIAVGVPDRLAQQLGRFSGTGGLPDPSTAEAAVVRLPEPATTLQGSHIPRIPATLRNARIGISLLKDGSVDLALEADSADDGQAVADAAALTEEVVRATSVKISILRVQLFKPIPFRAEGRQVKATLHLTPDEIAMLSQFAKGMQRR